MSKLDKAAATKTRVSETGGIEWHELYGVHTAEVGLLTLTCEWQGEGYTITVTGARSVVSRAKPTSIQSARMLAIGMAIHHMEKALLPLRRLI